MRSKSAPTGLQNGGRTSAHSIWWDPDMPRPRDIQLAAWNVLVDRGLGLLFGQGISPLHKGQQDGIELAAFLGQEIFVNPRRLPRRHFLQHPKADHFQPRGEQRFRQTQRRLDFSVSAKLEKTLVQYREKRPASYRRPLPTRVRMPRPITRP